MSRSGLADRIGYEQRSGDVFGRHRVAGGEGLFDAFVHQSLFAAFGLLHLVLQLVRLALLGDDSFRIGSIGGCVGLGVGIVHVVSLRIGGSGRRIRGLIGRVAQWFGGVVVETFG